MDLWLSLLDGNSFLVVRPSSISLKIFSKINEPSFLLVIDFPYETMGYSCGICGSPSGDGILYLTLGFPGLLVFVDEPCLVVSLLVAMGMGLLSGVVPARRAIRIDPVEALHAD